MILFNMRFKTIGLWLGVILLILCQLPSQAAETRERAPDFTLASKNHGNVRLQEQMGNVVLINFWAYWCSPCREELPLLEALQQDYADLGFTILAVHIDKDSTKADVLLNDIPVSFPVLFDNEALVSKLYDVSAMPTTVIVDRDGKQRLLHKGYKNGDVAKYEQVIKSLLRE
ncbi:TlpA disulfide reductase family protein [Paraglaciecola sp.]|uniref:TlpA family protein disulfide reductase n=1 Tax=Paraglaciecola sp. TaxID=1920173 RepID=UPI0030F47E14